MSEEKVENKEAAKTYTQEEVDDLISRKVDAKGRELGEKLTSSLSELEALRKSNQELQEALESKGNESLEELKERMKRKEESWTKKEKELLETHNATVQAWNRDKIRATFSDLVRDKISFGRDLAEEHFINHSKVVDGKVIYTDPKDNEEYDAEKAVNVFIERRPDLIAGPSKGTGTRAGSPVTSFRKSKEEMTSKDYFSEVEKDLKK